MFVLFHLSPDLTEHSTKPNGQQSCFSYDFFFQNSQESLQKVVNLLKGKLHDDEGFLSNRTRAFAAALALNQV